MDAGGGLGGSRDHLLLLRVSDRSSNCNGFLSMFNCYFDSSKQKSPPKKKALLKKLRVEVSCVLDSANVPHCFDSIRLDCSDVIWHFSEPVFTNLALFEMVWHQNF